MKSVFIVIVLLLSHTSLANAVIPNEFTVGSYNLYGIKDSKNLKEDLNTLHFVDIWAFQEVIGSFDERTKNKILEILPDGKWYIFIQRVNLIDDKKGTWEGQAIASRFPFFEKEIINLNHTDKKSRVAIVAKFQTESGREFIFANTDHEVSVFKINFNDRKKQLESLNEYFKNKKSQSIITGDFNTTDGVEEIKKTELLLSKSGFKRSLPLAGEETTFEKFFITTELDHIFTKNLKSSPRYRYTEKKGSDHYPIFSDINL